MKCYAVLAATCAVLLMVGGVSSDVWAACDLDKPIHITVTPSTSSVKLDYSRDLREIQKTKTDTVDPYGIHSKSVTQGFMEGEISMRRQVDLDFSVNPSSTDVCLWYKSIDVDVNIDPKIVIAKEVKGDQCMHKAVMDHEMKHVLVDRELVSEYAGIIERELHARLKRIGFVLGPIPVGEAQKYADAMVKFVMEITQKHYNEMSKERFLRQSYVDSLEEYERVKKLCPGFTTMQKKLYRNALKVQ